MIPFAAREEASIIACNVKREDRIDKGPFIRKEILETVLVVRDLVLMIHSVRFSQLRRQV